MARKAPEKLPLFGEDAKIENLNKELKNNLTKLLITNCIDMELFGMKTRISYFKDKFLKDEYKFSDEEVERIVSTIIEINDSLTKGVSFMFYKTLTKKMDRIFKPQTYKVGDITTNNF